MLYWIFDLDLTLYELPTNTEFNYSKLRKDNQLIYLLKNIPCEKLMFTNGTYGHAQNCIKKIELYNIFSNIVSRDVINCLKPSNKSYEKFITINKIKDNDKCVFFDDQPINLTESKKYGWITVLISKERVIDDNIDFQFPNIYVALNYFLSKIKNK